MNFKIILCLLFTGLTIEGCSIFYNKQSNSNSGNLITEKLKYPFGTILKMEVEVFDGDKTAMKDYEGTYLLKIKSVENNPIKDTMLMSFKDETRNFPSNDFELYKYLYGKEIASISSEQVDKMKQEYVGKNFSIVAYETGEFTGIPNGYFKYQEVRSDKGFHFRNYLIIISNSTNK